MTVGCFTDEFFNSISIHVHRRMRTSREGRFVWQVKIGVLGGAQVYFCRWIGVYEQTATAKVIAGSNLGVG
jgi:hypothetical protein